MEKATRFCHGKRANKDTSGCLALRDFGSSEKQSSDGFLNPFFFFGPMATERPL